VLAAREREAWQESLPARAFLEPTESLPELLARGRAYALALPDRPGLAASLALALSLAAERTPRRAGYFGNAANLLASLDPDRLGGPERIFATELAASGVYAEVGDFAKAFASLDRAAAALERVPDSEWRRPRQLLLFNSRAYFLATAPEPEDRQPDQALRLARLVLTSGDRLPDGAAATGSAAILDTMASAWMAAGEAARARRTQALALALAESVGLEIYLRHYDEFAAADGGARPSRD
ncbi:MAG: hypothetical protein LBV15_03805, partial [Planctomycetota bacterium]|nr:hypothetical protein [Planctomycetota bacterium]